jgi:hypothetical protein
MRILALMSFFAVLLSGQTFQRYDFTVSGGTTWNLGNINPETATSVSLGATGGYRVTRAVELEVGVFGVLNPVSGECGSFGCLTPDSHYIWVPFGARYIVPFHEDRFEWSIGGGAMYENFSAASGPFTSAYSYNGFGGYAKTSVAVALDRHRHFWLGATPRILLANGGNARDRWFLLTGDIGVRF